MRELNFLTVTGFFAFCATLCYVAAAQLFNGLTNQKPQVHKAKLNPPYRVPKNTRAVLNCGNETWRSTIKFASKIAAHVRQTAALAQRLARSNPYPDSNGITITATVVPKSINVLKSRSESRYPSLTRARLTSHRKPAAIK